jgi:hypothetical protein
VIRLALVLLFLGAGLSARADQTERIVLLRHGEKPAQGLGQLTCKGLNRALLLPDFLTKEFPHPDAIFAPDPSAKACELHGDGQCYDYVRPLTTIEPTAVRLGMPVDTQIGYTDIGRLADTLLDARYHAATIYVTWEHLEIVRFTELVLRRLGSSAAVPDWTNSDYDTIFELVVSWKEPPTVKLSVHRETLGEISDSCPTGLAK